MKKKLSTLLVLSVLVSCGKNEPITQLKKGTSDGINGIISSSFKAVDDTFQEANRTSSKVITGANDIKNELASNTGNFTEGIGQGLEAVAQSPKNAINQALGVDEKTDEELNELEKEVAQLEAEVEKLKKEFWEEFAELTTEFNNFKVNSENADQALLNEMENLHTELITEINNVSNRDYRSTYRLLRKLRDLRRAIREVEDYLDDMYVYCSRYYRTPFVSYCYLVTDEDEDSDDDSSDDDSSDDDR